MSKQYYLLSSLPELVLEGENYHDEESFITECRKWLKEQEIKKVLSAKRGEVEPQHGELSSVKRWKEFDRALRSRIVGMRKGRKTGSGSSRAAVEVQAAVENKNPLAAEMALEEARWRMLTSMELEFFFDLNRIAIYYLKLQTATRVSRFDKVKGERFFKDQCEVRYDGATGQNKVH